MTDINTALERMKILAQAGLYQCGHCAEHLEFEPVKITELQPWAIGFCSNDSRFSNITGELLHKGCPRFGIRLRIPVTVLECDVVEGPGPVRFE